MFPLLKRFEDITYIGVKERGDSRFHRTLPALSHAVSKYEEYPDHHYDAGSCKWGRNPIACYHIGWHWNVHPGTDDLLLDASIVTQNAPQECLFLCKPIVCVLGTT
jgi:hypothetical protein